MDKIVEISPGRCEMDCCVGGQALQSITVISCGCCLLGQSVVVVDDSCGCCLLGQSVAVVDDSCGCCQDNRWMSCYMMNDK